MRSALRKLCQHGIEALRPQRVNDRWRKCMYASRGDAEQAPALEPRRGRSGHHIVLKGFSQKVESRKAGAVAAQRENGALVSVLRTCARGRPEAPYAVFCQIW